MHHKCGKKVVVCARTRILLFLEKGEWEKKRMGQKEDEKMEEQENGRMVGLAGTYSTFQLKRSVSNVCYFKVNDYYSSLKEFIGKLFGNLSTNFLPTEVHLVDQ